MRICYIANSVLPSRSANSIHVMKMASAYASLGHRVVLLAPYPGRAAEAGVRDIHRFYGVPRLFRLRRVPLPKALPGTLTHGLLLPLLARWTRPDFVHSRSLAAAWGASCRFRIPTAYELHDAPSTNPRQRRMLGDLTKSQHLRQLMTITEALAEHVRREIPGSSPAVAPDGVDAASVDLELSREEARDRLSIGTKGKPLAVYAGHLYSGRGVGLILEVAQRRDDYSFLFVGGSEEDVERRRDQARHLENVRFLGFVKPALVPLYLRAADVLLMPYADQVAVEGGGNTASWASPMKMFEYMAAERPILASTLPVLQEVLVDGEDALLLRHQDPDSWSDTLSRVARDPSLAQHLASNARRKVMEFTWERRASSIVTAIQKVRT